MREKLDALDKSPGDHLWAAIEADLPKKKKRRMFPFWLTFISLVMIGLLIWSLADSSGNGLPSNNGPKNSIQNESGPSYDENNSNNAATVQNDGGNQNENAGITESSQPNAGAKPVANDARNGGSTNVVEPHDNWNPKIKTGQSLRGKKATTHSAQRQPQKFADRSRTKTKNKKSGKAASQRIKNDRTAKNARSNSNDGEYSGANVPGPDADATANIPLAKSDQEIKAANDSIAKKIAEDKKKKREKPKDSLPKELQQQEAFKTFSIFLYAAPTYYNTLSKSSPLDRRLDTLSHKAEITFNYGGYLCFDYNDKWSFRVGYARTSFKQRTTNIAVSSLNQQNYYNIGYGNISNPELQQLFAASQHFDLIQELTYTELPVEVKYKIISKQIGLEAIAGFSTNLLTGSNVTAESDSGDSYVLGSLKDQYKFYFSANVGVGLYWRFANNFRLNLEPIAKYHFRAAGTSLQPYSMAVLGGVEYTFNWKSKKKDK